MGLAQRSRSFHTAFSYGLIGICLWLATPAPAYAHPSPFSYLDLNLQPDGRTEIDGSLIVHIFDLGHDLEVDPVVLLEQSFVERRATVIFDLLAPRLALTVDGHIVRAEWSQVESLPDRQSVRVHLHYRLDRAPGVLVVTTTMFPYDPVHQTFVNFYDGEALTQAILNKDHNQVEYFARNARGRLAAGRKFLFAGLHQMLAGPTHILFLVGLLLLGGSARQIFVVVAAFAGAHSVALSLAALHVVTSPVRIIEPAIALSIVYVGADNLLVRDGRDARAWIALAFGLIHGFGAAMVFGDMEPSAGTFGWSLFCFNLGVAIGQLLVVAVVASVLAALRSRSEAVGRQLAFAGSIAVMVAGAFWFIQRVFFPGGVS